MNKPIEQNSMAGDPVLAGLQIIDADTHWSEPYDLWTSRAPARLKDRVPQMLTTGGQAGWMIDGHSVGFSNAASAVAKDGGKARDMSFMNWMLDDVHVGSWNVKARLELMDSMGIWAQIVYPNVLGFAGQAAMMVDPELRLISTQIYNDAGAEMQAESNNRLFPMALLPWWDIKLAVAEAERCFNMGLRGVNINSDPHLHGMEDLGGDSWAPLWEFCSDKGMPINFHIGASDASMSWHGDSPWPSMTDDLRLAIGSTMMFFSNARVITNLIFSGVLEKFPRLKFVSVESGVGWLPFVLEALDYEFLEAAGPSAHKFSLKPSEYFKRQIYGCFWFENASLVDVARRIGIDNVMFETDFPHPTCLYPDPLRYAVKAITPMTPLERFKVMSGNASNVYNIPVKKFVA